MNLKIFFNSLFSTKASTYILLFLFLLIFYGNIISKFKYSSNSSLMSLPLIFSSSLNNSLLESSSLFNINLLLFSSLFSLSLLIFCFKLDSSLLISKIYQVKNQLFYILF